MEAQPKKALGLFDSTCVIVGIIIGAGIYETAPLIASCMASPLGVIAIWLVGGLFALIGALCYAELASAYPRAGGDYVYQTRAYGRGAGYLFGWCQLVLVRPGDIALLSFIFARYAKTIYHPFEDDLVAYAAIAVVLLTLINVVRVQAGKWTQNVLTVVKVIGLLGILAAALLAPAPTESSVPTGSPGWGGVELALILVLFTYGGWNEMAYVAAEVKNPERNILRALVTGTVAVTVLYLLVNFAFLRALGYEGMTGSEAVAADTVAAAYPGLASRAISVLICVSTLGAINGTIFAGSRIPYAMGREHPWLAWLGRWNPKLGTPAVALVAQGAISLAIILLARKFVGTIIMTSPVFWLFFLGTGVSLFVLRRKDPDLPRPFRVVGYPVTPVLFCLCCAFMLYSSVSYACRTEYKSLIVAGSVIAAGVISYLLTMGMRRPNRDGD